MTEWAELNDALARQDDYQTWISVSRLDAPPEEVARHVWEVAGLTEPRSAKLYTAGAYHVGRRARRGEACPRVSAALAWRDARLGELEDLAWAEAERAGAPAELGFMGYERAPHQVKVSREVLERLPAEAFVVVPAHGAPDNWGLTPLELRFVMTPSRVPCVATAFSEDALRAEDAWTDDPKGARTCVTLDVPTRFWREGSEDGSVARLSQAFDDVLTALRVGPDDIVWCPEEFVFQPHVVMRQDDNGHDFEVETSPSRHAAAARARQFESAMHKQHYWIDPVG